MLATSDSILVADNLKGRADMRLNIYLASAAALALSSCGNETGSDSPGSVDTAGNAVAISENLSPFGDGYPTSGEPCRRLGESAATSNYLDDSTILIGCPSDASAASLDGEVVGNVDGVLLVSIPVGDANAATVQMMPMQSPVQVSKQALRDLIRSPGGLETKCLSRVNELTGGGVIGSQRIEEAESGVMIYVNVQGAQAPWQCFGSKDGALQEVYFGGDEGGL